MLYLCNMELHKIEKADKYLKEIKTIDAEIKHIEDLANTLANKKTKVKLSLEVEDLEKQESEKVAFDEDGSLVHGNDFVVEKIFNDAMQRYIPFVVQPLKEQSCSIINNFSISDTEALQVLGVLIYSKQQRRKYLINKINKL